ncbi:MAG: hypothetical protein WAO02_06995 [Verrucomicrobiia bacterium]
MNFPNRVLTALMTTTSLAVFCAGLTAETAGETIDPVFAPGLAILKKVTGTIETLPDRSQTDWRPNLQLLIGVRAIDASKETVGFVELTTLRPPPTNTVGHPWSPDLQTNTFSWSNTNGPSPVSHEASYISHLYPVRVRVFDETGRRLVKEGETTLPWGLLTNGLADMCRLSLELSVHKNRSPADGPVGNKSIRAKPGENSPHPEDLDKLAQTFGGGFIWLMTLLQQIQTEPAVHELWKKAHCAFRLPELKTMAISVVTGDFALSVQPRLEEVSLTDPEPPGQDALDRYRLPVDLYSGTRNLTRAELVVGPASGAGMLLGGIRSIRATHPLKPQQQFFVQVLSAGTVREKP